MKRNAYNFSNDLARIGGALSRAMLGNASDDAAIALAQYRDAQTVGQNQENKFLQGRNDAIETASSPTGIVAQNLLNSMGLGLNENNFLVKLQPPGARPQTIPAFQNQTTMTQADQLAQSGALARAIFSDGKYSPNQLTEALGDFGANRDSNMARSMILDPAATEDAIRRAAMILNQNQVVTERGQDIKSGDTQRGQDIKSGDTQRGQDIKQDTTERGQDIRSTDTQRGQDIRSDDTQRGQDIRSDDTQRGQDVRSDDTQRGQDVRSDDTQRGQDIRSDDTQRGQDIKSESGGFTVSPSDDTALRDFITEQDTENAIDEMSNAATIVNQLVNASVSAMGAKKSIPKAKSFITQKLSRGFKEFEVPNTGIAGRFVDTFNVPNFLLDELNATTGNVENDKAIRALKANQPDKFLNSITALFNQYGFSAEQIAIILE